MRWVAALVWVMAFVAAEAAAQASGTEAVDAPQLLVMLRAPASHFRPDANYAGGYGDAAGRTARRRLAGALARSHGLTLATEWPMPLLGLDCFVMAVPDARDLDALAAQLSRDERVAWAQPMHRFTALGHDDPLYSLQPAASAWRLDDLHVLAMGRNVRVAVIDSGVQADHPDLAGAIAASANLLDATPSVPERHGTAVAGIVAARADDGIGMVGVAPQSKLLALRACAEHSPTDTRCTTLGLALALQRALELDAQVINLSVGGPSDRLLRSFIDAALARGVGVVAAARRSTAGPGFPADVPGVVGVLDATDAAPPDGLVAAPGTGVLATLPPSRWGVVSGSSYAAAHVSGLLALMIDARSQGPHRSGPVSADLVRLPDRRVDACASLLQAGARDPAACRPVAPLASAARP